MASDTGVEKNGLRGALTIWQINASPLDAPGKFVVRAFDCFPHTPNPIPREEAFERDTLEAARAIIPAGLYRLERSAHDYDSVVETWI